MDFVPRFLALASIENEKAVRLFVFQNSVQHNIYETTGCTQC